MKEIDSRIAAMGATFNASVLAETGALLAPHISHALKRPPVGHFKYGSDKRHEVDLYLPEGGGERTMVLFVPGGGFVGGDKDDGRTFYRNVGNFLADKGFVCAIMNYRLAPAHAWPAGAQDVGCALTCLAEHAAEIGGHPARIHLVGQSAGAFHAATLLFHPELDFSTTLLSASLLSGPYQPELPPYGDNYSAYFGEDRGLAAQRGVVAHVRRIDIPIFLAAAQFDPPNLIRPSFALASAITEVCGRSPRFAWFAGHNHVSPVQAVGTPFDVLGPRLLHLFAEINRQ